MIFGSRLLSSFSMSAFYSFLEHHATLQKDIDKLTNLKNYHSGLGFDCLGTTCFLTLYEITTLVWVATPTMGTTGFNASTCFNFVISIT